MYLKLSYGTIEHTTEFITSNSSYKLEEVYYNDLSHADNSCSVKIPFNVDIQNFINSYSDNSILAQIKNTDGTNIFTGYVRKNYDFSKAQKNQALSLELVSSSFLLDVDTTQDITLENTTLDSVVNTLLADAKFSTATLASLSSYSIPIFTLDEGSNVKTTLDNLLQQYGFTFDFDKDGNFYVATLFSDIPTDKTTITQIFDGTNSIDEIKVEKKEQEYNGVNLSWTEYKNISNKLIFADTTNGSASENTCSIELQAGKYLTSGNKEDTGTSYYITYDSSEGDIVNIDSATLTLESSNNSGLTYSFTNLGKKGELSIYNKSSATITITKINVSGSGYVAGSENQTKTTTGKKYKDISGDYIHDSTNAKKFAQNYCDWQNYADYKISLKSNSDFALGSFAKITEYGLGTLYGRIIDKVYKLNSPIEYKIEAISDYEKAETTDYYTKNYKQGVAGADGKDGATGAKGDTGAKGADGTDSTAITISAPSSTTPESGMKYDKTYYGIYSGVWYKWSWSSTTTGAWTQVSASTPPTPAVWYSFDEMPDLPDASGNVSGDIVANQQNYTITGDKNLWTCVASGTDPILRISKTGLGLTSPFILCYDVFISVLNGNVPTAEGYMFYTDGTYSGISGAITPSATEWKSCKILLTPTSGKTVSYIRLNLIADASSATSTVQLKNIYVGYGTTSQPIIDNVSGEHNATGSGVVSVAGVSGKACQFVGSSHFVAKSPIITPSMSFNFWFTPDNVTDAMTLLQNRNITGLGISIFLTGGQIMFDFGGSRDTFGFSFVAGNIYHIGVDVNTTNKKLYINGELKQSINYTYADHSSYLTDYIWSGLSSLNGTSFAGNATKGIIDDLQIFNRELSASEHIGLYLDRGARAKLYTLADYNYESQVSSWEIVSSVPSFTRARSGAVTPSSVTFSAKAVIASAAQDYTGRFKIYLNGSSSAFYTSSSDESSHAYAIPSGTTSMKIELYKAGSTTALVATKEFAVPYAADVAPEYLGIGLLADVSGLTTKAYTSATITDAGVITPGSPVSAVIPGDWMINYTAGTYRALGIYYWSGSAWTITSDSKYTSDGVIEDICRLNNGGILIPDWTVYVNLIADNLFSHKIKLTTKTISGVTYAGVFYGGERFNADGSIADRTANGFYFTTDGKGWCNLQSDDLYNTIIGTNAGLKLISGSGDLGRYNSIYGMNAGHSLTSGYCNSLFGYYAGYNLNTGYCNSLFGDYAGYSLTSGHNNSLFGDYTGCSLTSGHNNSLFGDYAGYSLTSGYDNSLFGSGSGHNLTTGYSNSVFGNSAGLHLTTGNNNSLFGDHADVYTGAWNNQINLNNRIMYLEFASDATHDTVYKALAHYIVYSSGSVEKVGAMGRYGKGEINSIRNGNNSTIEFYNGANAISFTAISGSSTKILKPLQVAFIIPEGPTNK